MLNDNTEPDFYTITEKFRQHVRLNKLVDSQPIKGSHAAFTATLSGKDQAGNWRKPPPQCPCGRKEYFADCRYFNPKIRPSGWKPKKDAQERVDEFLQNPKNKEWVQQALAKWEAYQQRQRPQTQAKEENQPKDLAKNQDVGAFIATY